MSRELNFKELIIRAGRQNLDVDKNGEIDGYDFQARQIIRDLDRIGYRLVTPGGKKVQVTIRGEL